MGLIGIFTYFIPVARFQQYYYYHSLSKHSTKYRGVLWTSILTSKTSNQIMTFTFMCVTHW